MFNLVKTHFKNYIQFLKKPNPNPNDQSIKTSDKWKTLLVFIVLDVLFIIPAVFLIYSIDKFIDVDLDNHAISDLTNQFGIFVIILAGGIISPLIEEIIFRLPLNYKRNYIFKLIGFVLGKTRMKNFWFKYYTVFFYLFIVAFGIVHIFNYKDESLTIILLTPILILPQIIGGTIMAFLRMKIGFFWGFLQHAIFNSGLMMIAFFTNLEEKVFIDNEDFKLKIEVAENRYGSQKVIQINEDFDFITEVQTEYAKYNDIAERLNWETLDSRQNYKYFNINFSIKNLEVDSDSVLRHHLRVIVLDQ